MPARFAASLALLVLGALSLPVFAAEGPVHGLWVWKTTSVLDRPKGAEELLGFCKSRGINEVYVSISRKGGEAEDRRTVGLIELLHKSGIRVEALFGSADADMPGKPREELLGHVREIVQFNQKNPADRFDGIHLDIEPHQRPENKGPGNLKFLPDLVETYREVRALAEPAGMTLNADIPNKFLKGDPGERKMLLLSVPRMTLMLYELSSPDDGKDTPARIAKLRTFGEKYLVMAYDGLTDANLARMGIALRTPDYGELLPDMLTTLDAAFRNNPHYLGWARHSYNDHLDAAK